MGGALVADARQHRLEGDARQLQCGAFEVNHVAVAHARIEQPRAPEIARPSTSHFNRQYDEKVDRYDGVNALRTIGSWAKRLPLPSSEPA